MCIILPFVYNKCLPRIKTTFPSLPCSTVWPCEHVLANGLKEKMLCDSPWPPPSTSFAPLWILPPSDASSSEATPRTDDKGCSERGYTEGTWSPKESWAAWPPALNGSAPGEPSQGRVTHTLCFHFRYLGFLSLSAGPNPRR